MNAAGTTQAAIDKLELLKTESTRAPWHYWTDDLTGDVDIWHDQEVRTHVAAVGQYEEPRVYRDAELIVTLHRTIDAQLTILRDAMKSLSNPAYMAEFSEFVEGTFRHPLLLARAILGEAS